MLWGRVCHLCVWSGVGQRPDCPSKSEVTQGFDLIPVSVDGAGVQVGGGVEQTEEKFGMPRSDMTSG